MPITFSRKENEIIITFETVGQKYALLEIKIVMANLLRRFRFSVNEGEFKQPMIVPSVEVVLKPNNENGVPLIVSKR